MSIFAPCFVRSSSCVRQYAPVGSHLQNAPCSTIIVPGGSTILQTISTGGAAYRRTACFAGSLPLIQRCFCYSGVVLFADIHFRLYLSRRTSTPCPGAALAKTETVVHSLTSASTKSKLPSQYAAFIILSFPVKQPENRSRHDNGVCRDTSLFFVLLSFLVKRK